MLDPELPRDDRTRRYLIVLCANDHRRVTAGAIPQKSVVAFKRNLAVISGRYGEFEMRVIGVFAKHPDAEMSALQIPGGWRLMIQNLLEDGLIEVEPDPDNMVHIMGVPHQELVVLTDAGVRFVERYRLGEDVS